MITINRADLFSDAESINTKLNLTVEYVAEDDVIVVKGAQLGTELRKDSGFGDILASLKDLAVDSTPNEILEGEIASVIEAEIDRSVVTDLRCPRVSLLTHHSAVEIPSLSDSLTLEHEDICVCVIGVGYVGEHLLSGFGGVFTAIGFDVSQERLDTIAPDFAHLSNVTLTSDVRQLSKGTHFLISVPTNLHKDNTVNATHLLSAINMVTTHARPGSCVVIESSVSVGMTRAFLSKYSGTLHCGMSPERVDPGRTRPSLIEIPKVISALDPVSMSKINQIYSQVFDRVVPVSSPEVAEMTKLYENCYRMINIAYVNEIADACAKQGIDANEVIDAASTKPFGFQPFRPGLGVGGHCIPINPHYLLTNNYLPVLEHASKRMSARPATLANELHAKHSALTKTGDGLRVLVVGIGFKPGQKVISCSPGLAFARELQQIGCADLQYYDPLVGQKNVDFMKRLLTRKFQKRLLDDKFDLITVCCKQQGVDLSQLDDLKHAAVHYF